METGVLTERRLYVAWQDEASRLIHQVAVLVERNEEEGRAYLFAYLKTATQLASFRPFVAFPDLYRIYRSSALFPFFQNRVMSDRRPDYPQFVESLGLESPAEPVEILARTGGQRATDRVLLIPVPERRDDRAIAHFFVHGLRYVEGIAETLNALHAGDQLRVACDVQNPAEPDALLVLTAGHRVVGYIPNYLVPFAQDMIAGCGANGLEVHVERINQGEVPPNRTVFCSLTSCWPDGYEPFAEPDYVPVVALP